MGSPRSTPDSRAGGPRASVVICTYRRDNVLVDTIAHLLPQCAEAHAELIVVDQLASHTPEVAAQLKAWSDGGLIRYVDLTRSGLPHARNVGAAMASSGILVYFDDDIIPAERVIEHHIANYEDASVASVAGQVLDPGSQPIDAPGSFQHRERIEQFSQLYGANFSIRGEVYRAIGGSDENVGVHAYTEDLILVHKLLRAGYRICYDPAASVVHLMHATGGCRIGDETQQTAESDKSFSKLYWFFLAEDMSWQRRRTELWGALRHGPLRRQNVLRPWRQPAAWFGFGVATVKAYLRARGNAQRAQ